MRSLNLRSVHRLKKKKVSCRYIINTLFFSFFFLQNVVFLTMV